MISINLNELMSDLDKHYIKVSKEIEHEAAEAVKATAKDTLEIAQRLAPKDTWHLTKSIRMRENPDNSCEVFVNLITVPYARIQEYGGWTGRGYKSYIKAQPYMRPAMFLSEGILMKNLGKIFG